MTVYKFPSGPKAGEEIVVCDACGIAQDDTRPDVTTLEKVDFTAVMLAAGFPQGTALDVKDYCPACDSPNKVRKAAP